MDVTAINNLNTTLSASLSTLQFTGAEGVTEDTVPLLMPPWGYTVTAVVLFFIGFFGFFFNLIVIVLMFKDVQLWTTINIILLNLVCSDFSVSIFGNPFTFTAAIYRHWIFGRPLCIFYGYFMSLLGITSITTLTVLSYERFCLVCRPLSQRRSRNQSSYFMVILIWTYSLALTTPPIFGWGRYVVEVPNISCSVNWDSHDFNATTYIVYLFIFGLIVPMAVILYSYINIIRTMKQNSFRMGRVSKAESRVTMMVGVMIILFMVAWTPYSIFALMEQFGPGVKPELAVMPALMAKSSICYNPIIYVGMNTQYRAAWRRFWKGSDEEGSRSGLDTTVNRISNKISVELELLKKNKTKGQANNVTIVEEVSLPGNTSNSKMSEVVHNSEARGFVANESISNRNIVINMRKDLKSREKKPQKQRKRQLIVSLLNNEENSPTAQV